MGTLTQETSRTRSDIHDQLENLTHVVDNAVRMPLPLQATRGEQLAWEQIVAQLDATYKQNRAALLYHRNRIAPINRLPDEILLMIFLHAGREHARWQMTRYMYLSFVCRRWRALALDSVALWSSIELNCQNFALVSEILSRTKGSKISVVQGDSDSPRWSHAGAQVDMLEKLIAPRLHLVESLSLKLSFPRWKDILPMLQQPAPSLRHLHLVKAAAEIIPFSPIYNNSSDEFYSKPVDLPGLFNGVAPLRTLTYEMPQMPPWNFLTPLVHGLRELKLMIPRWDIDTHRPRNEQLLRFLEACPSLEIFSLMSGFNANSSTFSTTEPQNHVAMNHLSRVILYSTHDALLLKNLVTPQLKELSLMLDVPPPTSLIDAIASCFDLTTLKYLKLEGNPEIPTDSAILGSTRIPATHDAAGVDMPFSILFPTRAITHSLYHTIIAHSTNLEELHINDNFLALPHIQIDLRSHILQPARNIRTLSLSHYANNKTVVRALGEDQTLCPKLEYLRLCCKDASRLGKYLLVCVKSRRNQLKRVTMEGIQDLGTYEDEFEGLVDIETETYPRWLRQSGSTARLGHPRGAGIRL